MQLSGSSSGKFDRLFSSLSSNIQKVINQTPKYKNLIAKLGTDQDDHSLTAQLQVLNRSTNDLIATTNLQLKHLTNSLKTTQDKGLVVEQQNTRHKNLIKAFQNALTEIKKQQEDAAAKEKTSLLRQRSLQGTKNTDPFSEDYDYGGEASRLVYGVSTPPQQQKTMEAVKEAEGDLAQIQEREEAIKNLESDIVMVNEIYQDLAKMINEQGETIDSIEGHVEQAQVHIVKGNVELEEAVTHQRSARRKKLICGAIVFVVIVVLLLVVIIPIALKYGKGSKSD